MTRPCPGSVALRLAFTRSATRRRRRATAASHRRPTLRAAEPLSPSRPCRGALRRVGLERRPPRRRAHRQCAGPPYPQDKTQNASGRSSRAAQSTSAGARSSTARIAHPAAVAAPARRAVARRASARLSHQGRGRRRGLMNRKMPRSLWPQVEPFRSRRAHRGPAREPPHLSPCWRAEQLVGEGGFTLHHRRARRRQVGHPGAFSPTGWRLGGTRRSASSAGRSRASPTSIARWGSVRRRALSPQPLGRAKVLRDRWQAHIDAALSRPCSSPTRRRR